MLYGCLFQRRDIQNVSKGVSRTRRPCASQRANKSSQNCTIFGLKWPIGCSRKVAVLMPVFHHQAQDRNAVSGESFQIIVNGSHVLTPKQPGQAWPGNGIVEANEQKWMTFQRLEIAAL